MPAIGEVIKRTARSKTTYLGKTPDGRNRYAYYGSIGAIHYKDAGGNWQDIDASHEETDTDGFSIKFTKLPYLMRIAEDSGRRIYPDRNDLSYWIEFQKPFANMGAPTRDKGWFYWNFAHAIIGVKIRPEAVKFGFRLKDSQAPTSITIPFSTQGITRDGDKVLHNGEVVGYLRKPVATDALGIERDCQVSWGAGQVTISLDTLGLAFPIEIDPTFSVGASSDDAITYNGESGWSLVNTGGAWAYASYTMEGGWRFLNVGIAQGSTIDVAYGIWICSSSIVGTTSVTIKGDDEDDCATFSTYANYSGRARTDASASYTVPSSPGQGSSNNTSSLVPIVQEIVNRVGWVSGYALALLFTSGAPSSITSYWASWDNTTYDPPAIYLEWTEGGVTEKTGSDTGTGTDAKASGNPVATLTKSETGSGAESLYGRDIALAQSGAGVDATISLLAAILKDETGSGADAVEALTQLLEKSGSDSGAGAEAKSLLASLIKSDDGQGAEALLNLLRTLIDSGEAIDTATLEGLAGVMMKLWVYQQKYHKLRTYTAEVKQ